MTIRPFWGTGLTVVGNLSGLLVLLLLFRLLIVDLFIYIPLHSWHYIKVSPLTLIVLLMLSFLEIFLLLDIHLILAIPLCNAALTFSFFTNLTEISAHLSASFAIYLLQVKTKTLVWLARSRLLVQVRLINVAIDLLMILIDSDLLVLQLIVP